MASIYFVDTSALSKRYVTETGTAWLLATVDPSTDCTLYVARITTVELIAALSRRERGGTLSPLDAATARTAFRAHLGAEYKIIEITETLANQAMTLAETHGLLGYDAVQLAAALQVNISYRAAGLSQITLLSADLELNAAASAEGLLVDNPNFHP